MRSKTNSKWPLYLSLISCLVSCSTIRLSAQDQPDSTSDKTSFSGFVSLAWNYDDNILDYSVNDLSALEIIPQPGPPRFSIDKRMDNIFVAKLRVGMSVPLVFGKPTLFHLRYRQHLYAASTIKNFVGWELVVKQYFSKNDYASVGLSLLPHYYVRDIFYHQPRFPNPNRLPSRYIQESINKNGFDLEYGRRFFRRLWAAAAYEYDYTQYNPEFSERNNRGHLFSLSGSLNVSRMVGASASYRFSTNWANGRDVPDSSIGDISSRTQRVALGLDILLKNLLDVPVRISSDFTYENQTYVSDKPYVDTVDVFANRITYGDKYHYGRIDNLYRISTEVSYRIMKALNLFIRYVWQQNRTNLPETNDAGSYQTHQAGGGVEYSF